MGTDKTRLILQGKPLLRHLVDRLGTEAWDLFVAGGSSDHGLPALPSEVRVFPDPKPNQGPLAAFAGFRDFAASYDRILVLACDLPFFQHTHAQALLTQSQEDRTKGTPFFGSRAKAWIPVAEGRRQVLAGVYTSGAFLLAQELFAKGERKMQSFLDKIDFELLPQEDEKPFQNWNRPGDL